MPVFAAPLDEPHDVRSWEEWGYRYHDTVVSTDRDYAIRTASMIDEPPLWRMVTALTGPWQEGVTL